VTEAEWLTCDDPDGMLQLAGQGMSERKRLLLACACCRRIWPLITDERSRRAVETAERYLEGQASEQNWKLAGADAIRAAKEAFPGHSAPDLAAHATASVPFPNLTAAAIHYSLDASRQAAGHAVAITGSDDLFDALFEEARQAEASQQVFLIRELVGNPFREPHLDPACRTGSAHALTRAAYDERHMPSGHLDITRLAVLADALEEAGCADADLLAHLRGPGPHVRGCWALDAVLGKQ
jgi:hypothetical protein